MGSYNQRGILSLKIYGNLVADAWLCAPQKRPQDTHTPPDQYGSDDDLLEVVRFCIGIECSTFIDRYPHFTSVLHHLNDCIPYAVENQ